MLRSHLIYRILGLGLFGAGILTCSTPARGAPHKPTGRDACMTAFEGAQDRQQSGRLREARELLMTCAKATCSKLLREKCRVGFTQLDSEDIPTIVPRVADDAGALGVRVQVRMDGELLTSRLDGQALSVDPGMHEFSFSTDAGVVSTQKLLIVQGEHNRPISVRLHLPSKSEQNGSPTASVTPPSPVDTKAVTDTPASAAASPNEIGAEGTAPAGRAEGRNSAIPFVFGGAALAGIAAGASEVFLSKPDASSLAADVAIGASVGVGVAALVIATWVFVSPRPAEEKVPSRAAYVFDVQPARSGAFATLSGAF